MANTPQISRLWATTPESPNEAPTNEKYLAGWSAEIPTYQMFNYLLNKTDTTILALAERGVFEWIADDVAYTSGALAWDELDGKIYVCTTTPGVSTSPSLDPDHWELSAIQLSKAEYDLAVDVLSDHQADLANPHRVTALQANTYTQTQIDASLADITAALATHEADFKNPHGVTAAQAGGVPISGGTYTGAVSFSQAETLFGVGATGGTNASLNADVAGVYLSWGAFALGLDPTGQPVFNDGSPQEVVIETNFDEYRGGSEAEFAVPLADFYMPLTNDINIYEGGGLSEFLRSTTTTYLKKSGVPETAEIDEMPFSETGSQTSGDGILLVTDEDLRFALPTTLHAEGRFYITQAGAQYIGDLNGLHFERSLNQNVRIVFRTSANTLDFREIPNTSLNLTTTTAKYSAVLSSNALQAYVDGVLVGSWTVDAAKSKIAQHFGIGNDGAGVVACKDLQVWATALTPEQVSTL